MFNVPKSCSLQSLDFKLEIETNIILILPILLLVHLKGLLWASSYIIISDSWWALYAAMIWNCLNCCICNFVSQKNSVPSSYEKIAFSFNIHTFFGTTSPMLIIIVQNRMEVNNWTTVLKPPKWMQNNFRIRKIMVSYPPEDMYPKKAVPQEVL